MFRLQKIISIVALVAAPVALLSYSFSLSQALARRPLDNALIEAVKRDDLAQVESLLARGADIDSHDNTAYSTCFGEVKTGRTPLLLSLQDTNNLRPFIAPKMRDLKMFKMLLKRGANPDIGDFSGQRPLHLVAFLGNVPAVWALLQHGANANVVKNDGDTPLIEAAYRDHLEIVKLLLSHGADVNVRGQLGFSALARTTGPCDNLEIMRLLLNRGADANTRNKFGDTPLHGATEYGRKQAILLLLQHGADANALNNQGETPVPKGLPYAVKDWQRMLEADQKTALKPPSSAATIVAK